MRTLPRIDNPRRKPPRGTPLNRSHPLVTPWWGTGNNTWRSEIIMPMLEGAGKTTANLGNGTVAQGTFNGGVSWSTSPFGPALSFDGSTGYVECDAGSGLPAVTTDLSVEGWVYMPSASCHGCAFCLGGPTTAGVAVGVGSGDMDTPGDHLVALYRNTRWIDTGVALAVGWHHIGVDVDDAGHPRVYLDGAQVYADTIGAMGTPDGARSIGRDPAASTRYWPGKIASCSMFRRQRQPWEMRQLFRAPFLMFERPRAYWAMTPAAGGATQFVTQSGTVAINGAVVKQNAKIKLAAVSPAGTQTKGIFKPLAGSVTLIGLAAHLTNKVLTGSVNLGGSLIKMLTRVFAGSVTESGALTLAKVKLLALSASIASAGVASKQVAKSLASLVAPGGSLIKRIGKSVGGSVAAAGAFALAKVKLLNLSAVVAPAGAASKQVAKFFSALVTPVGALNKLAHKILSGALSPTGAASAGRTVLLALSAIVASTTTVSRSISKALIATQSSAAALTKLASKSFSPVVAPIGRASKLLARAFTATAVTTGILSTAVTSISHIGGRVLASGANRVIVFSSRVVNMFRSPRNS